MAIQFRDNILEKLQGSLSNNEFANKLNLDYSTVYLLKKGKINPGHIIIENILREYSELKFEDVFILSN